MDETRNRSAIVRYGLPVAAGLAALLLARHGGGSLWSLFAAAALVTLAIAATRWINDDRRRSPAQDAWLRFPAPPDSMSREDSIAYAKQAIELSTRSAHERRMHRVKVWLIVLAVVLSLQVLGVSFR